MRACGSLFGFGPSEPATHEALARRAFIPPTARASKEPWPTRTSPDGPRRYSVEYRIVARATARCAGSAARASPFSKATGSCASSAPVRDVTERRRVEAALRESEQRFATLAEGSPVLLWVNGPEGGEFVNRAYLEFVGVESDEEVRGYDWSRFVHPDDRDEYLNAYQARVRHASAVHGRVSFSALRRRVPLDALRRDAAVRRRRRARGLRRRDRRHHRAAQRRGRAARRRPAEGRVPRDAGARAAQSARADPQRERGAGAALRGRSRRPPCRSRCCAASPTTWRDCSTICSTSRASRRAACARSTSRSRSARSSPKPSRPSAPLAQARSRSCCVLERDEAPLYVSGDRARLVQSVTNVLQNSVKFTHDMAGRSSSPCATRDPTSS